MGLDHAQLSRIVANQQQTPNARQMQAQQQAAMQQSQNRQMQNNGQMGSQANPVDITTPQVQSNSNIPSFAQQPSGNFAPPPAPQRQSSNGPGSAQTISNPLPQQWQQQQQQQMQVHQSPNRGKPWAGQDFSKVPFPIPEEKFLPYVCQILNIQNYSPPSIGNRAVDLYALFNLVHKNGGSVKVRLTSLPRYTLADDQLEGNLPVWSQIAAVLGFGENTQSGPSPRSTPQIAMQMSLVHAKFLSKLEDLYYVSVYADRVKSGQVTIQQQPQQQPQQQQQQQPQMSTQFLEAVARGGNGILNEQQKKALEGRKQSQIPGGIRPTGQHSDVGVLQAMRQNPKMASFWIKSKEEAMKHKLRMCIWYSGSISS